MIIVYEKKACPKCDSLELRQGRQSHTEDGVWCTRQDLIDNPDLKLSPDQNFFWCADPTNYKCVKCDHQLTLEEIDNLPNS